MFKTKTKTDFQDQNQVQQELSKMTYHVTYQVRPHLFQRILRTCEAIGSDGPISP